MARLLKEQKPDVKVLAVDPVGSVFYDFCKSGRLVDPKVYKVEGIGEDYLVKAVDFDVIDDILQFDDRESFLMVRRLAREEGVSAGGSSGSAMWAAMQVAESSPRALNIVVVLPDSGARYLRKAHDDRWMAEHGFA